MNKAQKGFTLIELMIVVAIIGILASIALPAYQDYLARAQAAESVVLLDGARTSLEDYAAQNGAFADGTAGTDDLAALGIQGTGTYGTLGEPVQVATDGGTIAYTFAAAGVNASLANKVVTYTRSASVGGVSGSWTCTSTAAAKYNPKGC